MKDLFSLKADLAFREECPEACPSVPLLDSDKAECVEELMVYPDERSTNETEERTASVSANFGALLQARDYELRDACRRVRRSIRK